MGTDVVNIYGWLICKVTVPQRTIPSFCKCCLRELSFVEGRYVFISGRS